MILDPYALHCPICEREVVVNDRYECPVCDTDVGHLVGWRVHAVQLYNRALSAAKESRLETASALLGESRQFLPEFADAALLHGKVLAHLGRTGEAREALLEGGKLGIPQETVDRALADLAAASRGGESRPHPGRRRWAAVFVVAVLGIVATLGAYRLGQAQVPAPEYVETLVTRVVTATPLAVREDVPTATPTPTPTLIPTSTPIPTPTATQPPPTPTPLPPTPIPCPGLAADTEAALRAQSELLGDDLSLVAHGCAVALRGSLPTQHLLEMAEQMARSAGAEEVLTSDVVVSGRYRTRPGDTLWSIASSVYGDGMKWWAIYDVNRDRIRDPNIVRSAVDLRLP